MMRIVAMMTKGQRCRVSVKTCVFLSFMVIIFLTMLELSVTVRTANISFKPRAELTIRDINMTGPGKKNISQGNLTGDLGQNSSSKLNMTRPDTCNNCFPHNYNFIINSEDICATGTDGRSSEITLIILITTKHANRASRDAIRSTWLSTSGNNTSTIRYAFLLGYIGDNKVMHDIAAESSKYNDILQEDFIDSYSNLTYKTIMALKWATEYCSEAKFLMKTDDDMYVNVPNVIKICNREKKRLQTSVVGFCFKIAKPFRNRRSKYYVSEYAYPHQSYPSFCSGTGYVTSMNVVSNIYNISANVPFFYLEDIYVSLCVKKLHFGVHNISGFKLQPTIRDLCFYRGKKAITAHKMSPALLKRIWGKSC